MKWILSSAVHAGEQQSAARIQGTTGALQLMENRLSYTWLCKNADKVHFYLLYSFIFLYFLSLFVIQMPSESRVSCGWGDGLSCSISPEVDFKTNMPILKKKPSRDQDSQVRNFFPRSALSLPAVLPVDFSTTDSDSFTSTQRPPGATMTPTLCVSSI